MPAARSHAHWQMQFRLAVMSVTFHHCMGLSVWLRERGTCEGKISLLLLDADPCLSSLTDVRPLCLCSRVAMADRQRPIPQAFVDEQLTPDWRGSYYALRNDIIFTRVPGEPLSLRR